MEGVIEGLVVAGATHVNGRRTHQRFAPMVPWAGSLHLLREVTITGRRSTGFTAVSDGAGVVGEVMTLDLSGNGRAASVAVRVAASRPVVREGSIRHELELELVAGQV